MPAWLIDLFANRQLNQAFLLLLLAPSPVWIAMILFPEHAVTRRLASPLLGPPALALLYFYFFFQLLTHGAPVLDGHDVRSVRRFLVHPLVFLVLAAHLSTANLYIGTTLYQESRRLQITLTAELILCWLFAPVALFLFAIRRLLLRR